MGVIQSFSHLNGNKLAAIAIKTSGEVPGYHELLSIAVIILDGQLKPDRNYSPFVLDIVPNNPENIDLSEKNAITSARGFMNIDKENILSSVSELRRISSKGMESFKAAELFENWFEKLNLPEGRKISPLAYNWRFSAPFVMAWLGGPLNFDYILDSRYRDLASTALFLNDYADYHSQPYPFPKVNIGYICSQLKIPYSYTTDTDNIAECLAIAESYKLMLQDSLIKYPEYE